MHPGVVCARPAKVSSFMTFLVLTHEEHYRRETHPTAAAFAAEYRIDYDQSWHAGIWRPGALNRA